MSRLKLMTIVGTRPEIIRLSSIIRKCDTHFNHILIHTGQNYDYELSEIFFEDLKIRRPDVFLNTADDNLGRMLGNIIANSYEMMQQINPDAVLVLGDTNSCLSIIGAKRLHIPVFHLEAGNRCFDEQLPEEVNRRIVDVTSDVNLCYSEHARRNLLNAGVPKERVFVVGSPMPEVLRENLPQIQASHVLGKLRLKKRNYILLSAHREENINNPVNFTLLVDAINTLAEMYDMPVIYSCHPRSKSMIEKRNIRFHRHVHLIAPLGFHDYNHLQINAYAVISDSGTLPEEASYFQSIGLPFPAISIRTSTERPEALEQGQFILAGRSKEAILPSIEMAVRMIKDGDYGSDVRDYREDQVSVKVIKIIQSYTPIVNEIVWRKLPTS